METVIITILGSLLAIVCVGFYIKWRMFTAEMAHREEERRQRVYELAVLKEIGDRIGYELDVRRVMDIIASSLRQFLDHTAVAYMLLEPSGVDFTVRLERSTSRKFIDTVRGRMLTSLSALLGRKLSVSDVHETLTGAILREDAKEPVRSFFNIPLTIGDRVVGVLTVAHTKGGLYKDEQATILYKIVHQASRAVSRLEEVVRIEQGKMSAMVESMVEGVVMTDPQYHVTVVNPAAKKLIGKDAGDAVTIFDFMDSFGHAFDIRGRLEESMTKDAIITVDEVQLGTRHFQVFVAPVKGEQGNATGDILGGVVIFHDVTYEREQELMQDRLTSMIVHELRSPLDGIRKMIEFLQDGATPVEEEKEKKYFGLMHENASRMLSLVNDLYDISKLEAGDFKITISSTDIRKVLSDVVAQFKTEATSAGVFVACAAASSVPQSVACDGANIQKVIGKLISNAIKFTDSGGEIHIGAFLHRKGHAAREEVQEMNIAHLQDAPEQLSEHQDALVIAVADTGRGIPKEQIEQLFNKFVQFEQTARSGKKRGSGLGLSIAKGIVEAHGGRVYVHSEEGAGSVFYFTIPLDLQPSEKAEKKRVAKQL